MGSRAMRGSIDATGRLIRVGRWSVARWKDKGIDWCSMGRWIAGLTGS